VGEGFGERITFRDEVFGERITFRDEVFGERITFRGEVFGDRITTGAWKGLGVPLARGFEWLLRSPLRAQRVPN
jgi:hypothetical protein